MTFRVDSEALVFLNRALGLSGNPSGETILDDGFITQVIDVAPIARRGLPPGSGLWYVAVEIIHTATGDLAVSIDPYDPIAAAGVAANKNGYPASIPKGFDIWCLGAAGLTSDVTDFNTLCLLFTLAAVNQGIAVTNTAGVLTTPAPGAEAYPLGFFDTTVTIEAGTHILSNTLTGDPQIRVSQRIRRGELLIVRSNADVGGTVANIMMITLGLFPEGLGQDVQV